MNCRQVRMMIVHGPLETRCPRSGFEHAVTELLDALAFVQEKLLAVSATVPEPWMLGVARTEASAVPASRPSERTTPMAMATILCGTDEPSWRPMTMWARI